MYNNGIPKKWNLWNTAPDIMPIFNTKKWIEGYDQSGGTCNVSKQIRFKTSIFLSDLWHYSDA